MTSRERHYFKARARDCSPDLMLARSSGWRRSVNRERGMRMRIGRLILYVSSALAPPYAVAQEVTRQSLPSAACIEFNQTALNQLAGGHLENAASALSAALADRANSAEQSCAWLTLHNLAVAMV